MMNSSAALQSYDHGEPRTMKTDTLNLTGPINTAPDLDRLYDDLAATLMALAQQAIVQRSRFHLALSGGSTPKPFYQQLATDPRFDRFPWEQTHLWIVDERRVPEDDERSNVNMIRHSLADHVPLRREAVHPMPVLDDDPVGRYEQELETVFGLDAGPTSGSVAPCPRLDFVLLGIGDDGHTASLFPHSPAIGVTDRWIATNDGPTVTPPPRVTMTFPLLNAAREIAVLVTGAKKAAVLQRISEQLKDTGPDAQSLPITGIRPADGQLTWYIDAAAAGSEENHG